jgi:hypothetical protein
MRSWLMMSAVGLGWAASASAAGPVSPSIQRAEAILSAPEQMDISLVSCTTDECAAGGACDAVGDCIGEGGCGLFGGDGCGLMGGALSERFDLSDAILGEDSGWDVGGWLQSGYTNKSDGVLNTRPDSWNVHQAWVYVEKIADGSEGLAFGGRFDAMYGLDGENTQAYGNPNRDRWDFQDSFDHGAFHWAMPQAYGTVAYDKLSVKVGHFYTPAGYEVVPATGNFFYSHAFTWNFTEPFTHTGALASYAASDELTLMGGWVAGWDSGFARFNGASSFIGGATVKVSDDVTVAYVGVVGNNGWIGDGNTHHLVTTVALTDKLTYVLSSDINHGNLPAAGGATTFHSVSAANYLIYNITDELGAGARAEWAKINGVSYYETTFGLNVKPTGNLVIRPEIRHQWSPAGQKGNNPIGVPVDETIFGVDAVLSF